MTQRRKTHVTTVAVLLAMLAIFLAWRFARPSPKEPPTPQDAISSMLQAARSGNVQTYIASYTGALQRSLQESARESTEPVFAKYLRDSNASIKGVAVGEPQPLSDTEVTVRVEYVYQDRNEAQTMRLQKSGGGWKIAQVDGASRVKSPVPYGMPVK
jgi:hypothetical protein